MTQLNINSKTAQKLKQLSQKTEKTLDEVLDLLLSRYSHTLINEDEEITDDVTWTDEEIEDLLSMKEPLSSKEIIDRNLLGGWADEGITDGLEWVKQQRANRRKKLQW